MSASKIVLGMPLYGHGFVLRNPDNHGFYDDATSACPPGPYTEEPGTWGYNEVTIVESLCYLIFYQLDTLLCFCPVDL